jgi:hypothetical protein
MGQIDHPFSKVGGRLLARQRHQNHELVAPIPDGEILVSSGLAQQIGYPDKGLVSDIVSIAVIDSLEVVQVHHEEGQRIILKSIPRDVLLEIVVKETTIVKTGEFVLKDQARRIFTDDLEVIQ